MRYEDNRTFITPLKAREWLSKYNTVLGGSFKTSGITPEEDAEILRLWRLNPSGGSSYYSTVSRIGAGFFVPEFDHNVDLNPNWKPKFSLRVYECSECGGQVTMTTNHSGSCYPSCLMGCYQIVGYPGTRLSVPTKHIYVRLATDDDPKGEYKIVKQGRSNRVR